MYNLAFQKTYEDGEVIIREGTSGDWVYFVISGNVEVSRAMGEKRIILGILDPGEIFGELAFFGAGKRTATVKAIGETTVGIIDRVHLDLEFNRLSKEFRLMIVNMAKRYTKLMDLFNEVFSGREDLNLKTLSLTFKDRQTFIRAYTGNVGNSCLFIPTKNMLRKGEVFFLKLQLPGFSSPIKIKSEVLWTRNQAEDPGKRPSGMGVKFFEIKDTDKTVLDQYIQGIVKEMATH
jgi:uncharacterized protein (TIGR02266 family)